MRISFRRRRANTNMTRGIPCFVLGALLVACGDDGGTSSATAASATDITADKDPSISSAGDGVLSGILDISIGVDPSVNGLDPGTLAGDIADGWTVRYDKLLATFGGVYAAIPAQNVVLRDEARRIVDLQAAFPRLDKLVEIRDARAGDYDSMEFALPTASGAGSCDPCDAGDLALMEKGGYSLYVAGTIASDAGQSCMPDAPTDCVPAPLVRFNWGIPGGSRHQGCPGFTIAQNETTTVTWVVGADRWLLTGFSPDAESSPRQAQWIADADLNRDGETTIEELQQIKASLLFPPELGYDLEGGPIPVDTAYDFLVAQVQAIGAANGCTRVEPAN